MPNIENKLIIKSFKLRKIPVELSISLLIFGVILLIVLKGTGNGEYLSVLLAIVIVFPLYAIQKESIEISISKRKINVYLESIFKKTKNSYSLNDFLALRIEYSIDKPLNTATSNFGASPHWGKVQYKSFDLHLISEQRSLKIKHFVDPQKAKVFQKELAKYIDKPIVKPIRIINND